MLPIKQTYLQRINQRTHKAFTIIISTNKWTSIKIIDINLDEEITVILSLSTSALHHALLRIATY